MPGGNVGPEQREEVREGGDGGAEVRLGSGLAVPLRSERRASSSGYVQRIAPRARVEACGQDDYVKGALLAVLGADAVRRKTFDPRVGELDVGLVERGKEARVDDDLIRSADGPALEEERRGRTRLHPIG